MPKGLRKNPKTWYVLIGNSKYEDPNLTDLPYSARDCQTLEQVFSQEIAFLNQPEVIGFLHDADQTSDPENLPNRANVLGVLAQMEQMQQENRIIPDDTIIFYFTGHGERDENGRTVLCVKDTNPSDLNKTGLDLQNILNRLAKLKCRQTIVFIDACYSGNVERPPQIEGTFTALLSCQPETPSWQLDHISAGIYSYYLIRGLRGEATNPDEISLGQLYHYIEESLKDYWKQWRDRAKWFNYFQTQDNIIPTPQEIKWLGIPAKLGRFVSKASGCAYPRSALAITGEKSPAEWQSLLQKCSCQNINQKQKEPIDQVQTFLRGRGLRVLYLRGKLQEEAIIFDDGTSLARSRLQEALAEAQNTQQLILLEDTGKEAIPPQQWCQVLSVDRAEAQCLIVYSSRDPSKTLLQVMQRYLDGTQGCTDADLLDKLVPAPGEERIKVNLTGDRGFMEVVPKMPPDPYIPTLRTGSRRIFSKQVTSNPLTITRQGKDFDDFNQIYVPLGLVQRKEGRQKAPEIQSPEDGSRFYEPPQETIIEKFQNEEFFEKVLDQKGQGNAVIVGEPGAGKSTYLQKCFRWLDNNQDTVPIWIALTEVKDGNLEAYLLNQWLPHALDRKPTEEDQKAFQNIFDRVYLLLDGADESSVKNPINAVKEQLTGWLGKARVLLSCRSNLWDTVGANPLASNFKCYRTLPFEPHQVDEFIKNYFRREPEQARSLQEALAQQGKERLRDLVRNPLRLMLLCGTWELWQDRGGLPDTQAQLYEGFVEAFYDWKLKEIKRLSHQEIEELQQRLNPKLGELARDAIDRASDRWRFTEREIKEKLGNDPKLVKIATQELGLLTPVGVSAENPNERLYAFIHPTFQEYFAACAIEDWDFFLPRQHRDRPVRNEKGEYKRYRVFEPQWKQVILLWVGRRDARDKAKEEQERREFICHLYNFEEGCEDLNFYRRDGYLVIISCTSELSNYSWKWWDDSDITWAVKFTEYILD